MIATHTNVRFVVVGPSDTNGGAGGIGAIFAKAYLLGTGDKFNQLLRHFHFKAMGQREDTALFDLCYYCLVNVFIAIA